MSRSAVDVHQTPSEDLASIINKFHQWAAISSQVSELKGRADTLRAELLAWAETHGEITAKGHQSVELPSEFAVPGGRVYAGWTREKRVSQTLSEERVRELAEARGLTSQIFKEQTVEVLDQNELYAAEQRGEITVAELDSLVDTHVTYALKAY